jgi:hypothetical protein
MQLIIMTVHDFITEQNQEVRRRVYNKLKFTPACVLRTKGVAASALVRENLEWFIKNTAGAYFKPIFCNAIYFESMADAIACKLALEK